jgi:AcrR family transcriptional regulator
VIAAARQLFGTQGYFQTGTADIVEAAQVGTRGALYHHFADKEALFAAVFEAVENDIAEKSRQANASGDARASGFELLSRGLNSYLDVASADGEVRRIILIDGPAVLGWEAWREVEARHGLGAIEQLLLMGRADGSIAVPSQPAALANMLLSLVNDGALFIAHAADPRAARVDAGSALNALLSGLATR